MIVHAVARAALVGVAAIFAGATGSPAAGYKVLYALQTNVGVSPLGGLFEDASGDLFGTAYAGGSGTACAENCGTVFELATNGSGFALHNFTGNLSDGEHPSAGLVAAKHGNSYGTTELGGANNDGAIFRLAPGGRETLLYSFTDKSDGGAPLDRLLLDKAGNLYGTSSGTVVGGYGAVFKLAKDGTFTVLYTFTDGSDGANPYGGLIADKSGNLYGTAQNAGNFSCGASGGCGVVYKIAPGGGETVLYAFNGGPGDCSGPTDGVIADKSGNLYGTTYYGGSNGQGCIFKLATDGTATMLHSFTGNGGDGLNPEGGLIQDAKGNFYGTTLQGGKKRLGIVFRLAPDGTETVLHTFAGGSDGQNPWAGLIGGGNGMLYGTTEAGGGGTGCSRGCGTIFEVKE